MTLRKEYEDAARDEKLSVADVSRWVRTLNFERQWRQSGYTVASARAELDAAKRHRDECLLSLRAAVIRWVRALNYERQWRQSGYTVASAGAELGAAQRRRDECLLRLRAAERALTEAGEVVP